MAPDEGVEEASTELEEVVELDQARVGEAQSKAADRRAASSDATMRATRSIASSTCARSRRRNTPVIIFHRSVSATNCRPSRRTTPQCCSEARVMLTEPALAPEALADLGVAQRRGRQEQQPEHAPLGAGEAPERGDVAEHLGELVLGAAQEHFGGGGRRGGHRGGGVRFKLK